MRQKALAVAPERAPAAMLGGDARGRRRAPRRRLRMTPCAARRRDDRRRDRTSARPVASVLRSASMAALHADAVGWRTASRSAPGMARRRDAVERVIADMEVFPAHRIVQRMGPGIAPVAVEVVLGRASSACRPSSCSLLVARMAISVVSTLASATATAAAATPSSVGSSRMASIARPACSSSASAACSLISRSPIWAMVKTSSERMLLAAVDPGARCSRRTKRIVSSMAPWAMPASTAAWMICETAPLEDGHLAAAIGRDHGLGSDLDIVDQRHCRWPWCAGRSSTSCR